MDTIFFLLLHVTAVRDESLADLPTPKDLETQENKSGDCTKNSVIPFFFPIKPLFHRGKSLTVYLNVTLFDLKAASSLNSCKQGTQIICVPCCKKIQLSLMIPIHHH